MVQMTHVSTFRQITASDRWGAKRLAPLTLVVLWFLQPAAGFAADVLPQGGSVAQGNVAISTPGAGQMVINQSSDRAVVNWNGFSIGQGNSVDIRQPSTSSAILNRVTGNTTSEIHGQLTATGQVFVVNPNGIFIGEHGVVSAGGGFVASTLDTSDENFMANRLRFEGGDSSASVQNAGRVSIGRGGFAALLGGRVSNSGIVTVPMGRIALGAGELVTLDVSGDQFLQVAVPSKGDTDEMRALIENSGTVAAEGGLIEMHAATARDAARNAINLSGVAEARSVSKRGGMIVLGGGEGGHVQVSGRVTTRAKAPMPTAAVEKSLRPQARPGGDIIITGRAITLEGAQITADGGGDGGRINIGGAFQGSDSLPSALYLGVDADTLITADAGAAGDGGRIILWSDLKTTFGGQISARGGAEGGNGGFVEVSGKQTLAFSGLVDTSAPQGATGTLLLDPHNIIIADEESSGVSETEDGYYASNDDAILSVSVLELNLEANNITISTSDDSPDDSGQDGNITVNIEINWDSPNTLTFQANNNVTLNAGVNGPNGEFRVNARGAASDDPGNGGSITTGPGGFVNVGRFDLEQGHWMQVGPDLPGFTAGDFRLASSENTSFLRVTKGDGTAANPYQLIDIYGVQGIGSMRLLDKDFALSADIDAKGTAAWNWGEAEAKGFAPIGNLEMGGFSGRLAGEGHTITGLTSNRSVAGLFGLTEGATISDLTLSDVSISGGYLLGGLAARAVDSTIENVAVVNGTISGSSAVSIGGIVGELTGAVATLSDSSFTGTITANGSAQGLLSVGGAVGMNSGMIIASQANSVITVASSGSTTAVGGFAGLNTGDIIDAVAEGTVGISDLSPDPEAALPFGAAYVGGFTGQNQGATTRTAARGNVSSKAVAINAAVGGHTGFNDSGTILDSYANGDVTSTSDDAHSVGGLVGSTQAGAITNTYASGAVVGGGSAGGLIGQNSTTPVAASYWNSDTSGQIGGGPGLGEGLTSAEFENTDDFFAFAGSEGWDFDTVWAPGAAGRHASIYSIDRVVFAQPDLLALTYGQTPTQASGSVAGGPLAYVFADKGETLDTAPIFTTLALDDNTAGTHAFTLNTASLTSSTGKTFNIVALEGVAEISKALLTLKANDAAKTYGTALTFDGTEFTVTGGALFFGDSVDTITLASTGAAAQAQVTDGPYAITADGRVTGTGMDNYTITFEGGALNVTPAPLTLTANDATKAFGDEVIFDGTEFTARGLLFDDSVDLVNLTSDGAPSAALAADSPFDIVIDDVTDSYGLSNYDVTFVTGTLTVGAAPAAPADPVRAPDIPDLSLPNPQDTLVLPGDDLLAFNTVVDNGSAVTIGKARDTLAVVQEIATTLEIAADRCSASAGDVDRYLACISDALDDFAKELDAISTNLPPGMEDVARIVRDAREGVGRARLRAQSRLAGATTDAEREQIRRDAIGEARAALDTASSEIRKAITLVRADDPELAAVQRATINTVAAAIDNVGIKLSRVEGL